MPSRGDPLREQACGVFVGCNRHRLFGKRDGVKPPQPAHAQARAGRIERHLVARDDAVGKARFDLGECHRRGEQDAAGRRAAGQFGDRKIGLAGQRRGGVELRAAAIGKQKRPAAPPRFFAIRSG